MMKKIMICGMLLGVLSSGSSAVVETEASNSPTKVAVYKTCKDLNKVYSSGVRVDKSKKNVVVNRKTKKKEFKSTKAVVNAKVYNANKHLDNDKDGIACEK